MPDLSLERTFWQEGRARVAGVDEVGRGSLFGPVVAAAVILPAFVRELPDDPSGWPDWLRKINDSKRLTPLARRKLARTLMAEAESVGLGQAAADEIDRINIHRASLEAMKRAVGALSVRPDALLLDGFALKDVDYPLRSVPGGDLASLSIASASIIAKVFRDEIVMSLDSLFQGYGLAQHKGYGTPEHYRALARLGPTPLHRRSFRLTAPTEGRD